VKNIKLSVILLFSCSICLYAQNDAPVVASYEDLFTIVKIIEERRIKKQSEILNYTDLPGTFWVVEEPYIIEGKRFFFHGYIFLDENNMLDVQVEPNSNIDILKELSLHPLLYISFINSMMTYKIIDDKIIVMDKELCYLQDSFLYFFVDEGFKKYRLENWFYIYDDQE
jgi:hypothetical protein